MSREPKNNEEGFMYKLASFIVDKRNLIFLIVAIGLVFSVFSRNWVQVENQLSAYLPKDSETYKGLHLMEDEFITFGTAKVMLVNVTYDEAQAVSERLGAGGGGQSGASSRVKQSCTPGASSRRSSEAAGMRLSVFMFGYTVTKYFEFSKNCAQNSNTEMH